MSERAIKLPDVGEGVAEAELVEWHVKLGDFVREDTLLAAVMTDKATVEIPSPVEGEVIWMGAQVGDVVAIGSELVRLKVSGDDAASPAKNSGNTVSTTLRVTEPARASPAPKIPAADELGSITNASVRPALSANQVAPATPMPRQVSGAPRREGEKPITSPAVRMRARKAGVDLRQVAGTGPAGRITHEDLDTFFARVPGATKSPYLHAKTAVDDVKLIGLRRKIAEKMSVAHAHIPQITYVEEIDVTSLE